MSSKYKQSLYKLETIKVGLICFQWWIFRIKVSYQILISLK